MAAEPRDAGSTGGSRGLHALEVPVTPEQGPVSLTPEGKERGRDGLVNGAAAMSGHQLNFVLRENSEELNGLVPPFNTRRTANTRGAQPRGGCMHEAGNRPRRCDWRDLGGRVMLSDQGLPWPSSATWVSGAGDPRDPRPQPQGGNPASRGSSPSIVTCKPHTLWPSSARKSQGPWALLEGWRGGTGNSQCLHGPNGARAEIAP